MQVGIECEYRVLYSVCIYIHCTHTTHSVPTVYTSYISLAPRLLLYLSIDIYPNPLDTCVCLVSGASSLACCPPGERLNARDTHNNTKPDRQLTGIPNVL